MIIDNIENFEKSQKDDKNINKNLLIKISEGINFGKDISNEINNINKIKDIHNKQNLNTKNLSTINGININFLKNKDKKPVIKNNDENKIKNKNNENIQNNIIQLKFIKNVNANQNAAQGKEFSGYLSVVLTDEGNIFSTGCNKYGELGLGKKYNKKNKYNYMWISSLSKLNIKHIAAGGHHSWCLLDNNNPIRKDKNIPEPLLKSNFSMNKKIERKLSN